MIDPREEAEAYIKEHNINTLFQELGTRVMYHRPKDPNKFLLEALDSITIAKKDGTPTMFFTMQDLDAMFSLFDPTDRGYISLEQYHNALKTLCIDDPKYEPPTNKRVGKSEFRAFISRELKASSVTSA